MELKVLKATIKKEFQVRLRAYPISFMVGCIFKCVFSIFKGYRFSVYYFRRAYGNLCRGEGAYSNFPGMGQNHKLNISSYICS